MLDPLNQILRSPLQVVIELALIWICVFFVFRFLLGTRGAGIMRGLVVVFVVVSVLVGLATNESDRFVRIRHIYDKLAGVMAILLIVVFQPELRQAMVRLSELVWRRNTRHAELAEEVATAAEYLSRNQFGALIVIERSVKLGGLVEAGTKIDSLVSAELLESIFYPNNPLHDLAVVIRGDRILAAKVQLPLADGGPQLQELGSRHRAGVGVTMETDCLTVIVSEETGLIRLAERGQLSSPIPRDELRERLAERLSPPEESEEGEVKEAVVVDLREEPDERPTSISRDVARKAS